jgi:hypothetical protein
VSEAARFAFVALLLLGTVVAESEIVVEAQSAEAAVVVVVVAAGSVGVVGAIGCLSCTLVAVVGSSCRAVGPG